MKNRKSNFGFSYRRYIKYIAKFKRFAGTFSQVQTLKFGGVTYWSGLKMKKMLNKYLHNKFLYYFNPRVKSAGLKKNFSLYFIQLGSILFSL